MNQQHIAHRNNVERCKNYGGYSSAEKTLVCGLNASKQCAGFNRLCDDYRGTRLLRAEEIINAD